MFICIKLTQTMFLNKPFRTFRAPKRLNMTRAVLLCTVLKSVLCPALCMWTGSVAYAGKAYRHARSPVLAHT